MTESQKKSQKKYRDSHPEKTKERNSRNLKTFYLKNKDKIKAKVAEYAKTEKGKDVSKKSQKKFKENNPERYSAIKKKWRENNREKINKLARDYQKLPFVRAKKIVYNINRIKQYKEVSDGTVTPLAIKSLYFKQNGKCALSGFDLNERYHIDHIIPVSKGGLHSMSNIQLLLPIINLRKSNKINYSLC